MARVSWQQIAMVNIIVNCVNLCIAALGGKGGFVNLTKRNLVTCKCYNLPVRQLRGLS